MSGIMKGCTPKKSKMTFIHTFVYKLEIYFYDKFLTDYKNVTEETKLAGINT